ncbi:hypothetical protein HHL14_05560 [Paraburkholderia sp. G-4-1-8]|uniref:Uncharacterized protein n=1 Tax=Paraburkholderia antibiotica TaxID=2728839 RepID=A0A7X9ZX51_9BURK|nr:hypothetical protein [Paraburkholderia antibiotica]
MKKRKRRMHARRFRNVMESAKACSAPLAPSRLRFGFAAAQNDLAS